MMVITGTSRITKELIGKRDFDMTTHYLVEKGNGYGIARQGYSNIVKNSSNW
jgi:hypothetical protein